MTGHNMRKHALRRYIVFRVKTIEFLDIGALRQGLKANEFLPYTPVGRTCADFADSLRTVLLSWFSIFIDKSKDGMDIIKLWKELFPNYKSQIEQAWAQMEPTWDVLRNFRNKAGFHADKPLAFFKARREIGAKKRVVAEALKQFERLFRLLLKAESTELPDLENAVDDLLNELEANQAGRYNRAELKRYLMLPHTAKRGTL